MMEVLFSVSDRVYLGTSLSSCGYLGFPFTTSVNTTVSVSLGHEENTCCYNSSNHCCHNARCSSRHGSHFCRFQLCHQPHSRRAGPIGFQWGPSERAASM